MFKDHRLAEITYTDDTESRFLFKTVRIIEGCFVFDDVINLTHKEPDTEIIIPTQNVYALTNSKGAVFDATLKEFMMRHSLNEDSRAQST